MRKPPGDGEFFPYPDMAGPLAVRGGIRARSQRGGFGESWWARRWIGVVENANVGSRLSRGRDYARRGQVLSIDVVKGSVTARVQGSRPRPYRVRIRVKRLMREDWKIVAAAVSRRPDLVARILAGELPEEIDEVIRETGMSLFPEEADDLAEECSCPDWIVPCKHIAAVYYLLAEEIDRDAFLILRLRGIERSDFARLAGAAGAVSDAGNLGAGPGPANPPPPPETAWKTLHPLEDEEWVSGEAGESPEPPSPLLEQLGSFPFWRGGEDLVAAVVEVQRKASPLGLAVARGRAGDGRS